MVRQPSTLKNVNRWLRARRGSFLFLALEGDRPLAGGARFDLQTSELVQIGRTDVAEVKRQGAVLQIGVPDPWLSSAHLELAATDSGWVAHDKGSSNGTFVNGERISERALAGGDAITAGHAIFVFQDGVRLEHGQGGDLTETNLATVEPAFATLLPELAARLAQAERVARSPISTLLSGETGTGKEVLAGALHRASAVRGPLVAVNCGALPPALVEASLFGHQKGAFTGADADRPGLVQSAAGGTLFLDEIGDLPLPAQAALLRVLQESEVTPVGAVRPVKVNLRVLAATNRDLPALVAQGRFRADLYARLSGFSLELPPLRERREDTGLFVAALLRKARAARATLTHEVCELFLRYPWPLNVRELQNALYSALALAGDQPIELAHLPAALRADRPPPTTASTEDDQQRRAEIDDLLRQHGGNVSAVARTLGKARMQVHRWLRRYGLDPASYRK